MKTVIDSKLFPALRAELESTLKPVADKLGIQIAIGRGTYDRELTNGTIKLELSTIGDNGVAETKEVTDFRSAAGLYGLRATDLGREFTAAAGKRFRVSGLRAKARTKPILAVEVSTGKEYIWPADSVKMYLDREAKTAEK